MKLSKSERERLINNEAEFDAYLNSVRAEGVEMLSETLPAYAYYQAEADIKAFAAQLRAGKDGE